MIAFFKFVRILLELIRCFPHIILFYLHKNHRLIQADVRNWLKIEDIHRGDIIGLVVLLSYFRPFRNVFYYRVGYYRVILNIICPKLSTLKIATAKIDEGLYIEHGFSTTIGAKSIGKNCWINQQVTIGSDQYINQPVILNNVKIHAGAVIIGKVTIGNNVVIGANATVFKDIPDNCTVYPAPSRIIHWGEKNASTDDNKDNQ